MTRDPNGGRGIGINANVALLLSALAYALVNFVAILFLIYRVMGEPFSVLGFFAFVGPVAACSVALLIHQFSEKGLHPLALTVFFVLMIFAAWLNFQFYAQAANAV
jgi:hypothetical protein